MAALLLLIPFNRAEMFRAVEAACGEGALSHAVLDYYPNAQLQALDGSESMRQRARSLLTPFAGRVDVDGFDLTTTGWLDKVAQADCVLSSLVIHHLPDAAKMRLFADIAQHLGDRGALLIADVVAPLALPQRSLFSEMYDREASMQSLSRTGSHDLYELFVSDRWNVFKDDSLPQDEYLSPLFDQLAWLRHAGFHGVDCFWLRAGFAIFGGYKTLPPATHQKSFNEALQAAQLALKRIEQQ